MPTETASQISLPTAARKQIKEANRLIAELNAKPGEKLAEPAAGAAASEVPPEPPAAPAPDPVKEVEHKYRVLAGKYNTETARLAGQVQALMDENRRLMEQRVAPAQGAAPMPRETQFDLSVVTQKEREEYGDELVNLMARIAKANAAGAEAPVDVQGLKNEIARLQSSVQQTVEIGSRVQRESIWTALDSAVPTWRTINTSQEFLDWLDEVDIISGVARMAGLTEAFENGDAPRVVAIFRRYEREDSQARQTASPPPRSAPVDQATLVAPGPSRGGGGEAPNGARGKIYSEQDIDDFYSRVQRKRIAPEEARQIEADLQAAVREGRVVPRRPDFGQSNSR